MNLDPETIAAIAKQLDQAGAQHGVDFTIDHLGLYAGKWARNSSEFAIGRGATFQEAATDCRQNLAAKLADKAAEADAIAAEARTIQSQL